MLKLLKWWKQKPKCELTYIELLIIDADANADVDPDCWNTSHTKPSRSYKPN